MNIEISVFLSIYAACLSTIVFIWNLQRAIPRFKVDLIFCVLSRGDGDDHGISVTVKNPSPHTVHLAYIDLLFPIQKTSLWDKIEYTIRYRRLPITVGWCHDSLSFYDVDHGCPLALEPGNSHEVFVPNEVLDEMLNQASERKIKASVQDQLWRTKYSKPFDYPIYKGDDEETT